MKVSENTLKWVMRLYIPMLIQRIWVKKIHKEFRGIDVKVNRSLVTINFGKSIFGGTIFSATDPFYALLFGQIMKRKGFNIVVWLKSASIKYIKPARTSLNFTITISDEMIADAEKALQEVGKFVQAYPIELYNTNGELCAIVSNEIYIRNTSFPELKK